MTFSVTGIAKTFELLDDIAVKYPYETVVALTEDVYDRATKNIKPHSKTGRMENNLDFRVDRDAVEGQVFMQDTGMLTGKGKNYALFVHFGTAPHIIEPKSKKSLRWAGVGGFVFAKRVNHPGYKGDPFLYNASKETFKNLDKIFTKVYNEI